MIYSLLLISIFDTKPSPTISQFTSWVLSLVMEIILLGASFALYTTEHREPTVDDPQGGHLEREMTEWEAVEVTLNVVRIICLIALSAFYMLFIYLQWRDQRKRRQSQATEEETSSLLGHDDDAENGMANGLSLIHI